MNKKNFLILGSGICEHIWAYKLKQSAWLGNLYVIPGNEKIESLCPCYKIRFHDFSAMLKFIQQFKIDFVIISNPVLFESGLVEYLRKANIHILAPQSKVVEISKSRVAFLKMMKHHGIPVPNNHIFNNFDGAMYFAKNANFPLVIKTDTIGKAKSRLCQTLQDVEDYLSILLKNASGTERVILESFIPGHIFGIAALVSGKSKNIMTMPYFEFIQNNFHTISAYTPSTFLDKKIERNLERIFLVPWIHVLNDYVHNFKGIIFLEIVASSKGYYVIDSKMHWDPLVTSLLLSNLKSDLGELVSCFLEDKLETVEPTWYSATVSFLIHTLTEIQEKKSPLSHEVQVFQEKSHAFNHSADKMETYVCAVANGETIFQASEKIVNYWREQHFLPSQDLQEGFSKITGKR